MPLSLKSHRTTSSIYKMCLLSFRMDIMGFYNRIRVKPSSVFMLIVGINLSLLLSRALAPVSGFPCLVTGVSDKGAMAYQARDSVFL
jgi:hypothetical protein